MTDEVLTTACPTYAERKIAEAFAAGDEAKVRYWGHIKSKVDEAPPLTPAQRDQLRVLLQPEPATHVPKQRQSKALQSIAA